MIYEASPSIFLKSRSFGGYYTPGRQQENGPFIDDFPIKTSIYKGFSMAMLNNQMEAILDQQNKGYNPKTEGETKRMFNQYNPGWW